MKGFKTFLTESSTADAINSEMAICAAYNVKQGAKNLAEGAEKAGIAAKKWEKFENNSNYKQLIKMGTAVATGMSIGNIATHSGAGSAATHYLAPASDTTPKSDLYGDTKNRCSLKKSGDKGEGAQLMSAMSGEAAGVLRGALSHFRANGGDLRGDAKKGMNEALKMIEEDMGDTVRRDLNIEVKKGKEHFEKWYFDKSGRAKVIASWIKNNTTKLKKTPRWAKKLPTKEDIVKHMKDELATVGATKMNIGKNIIHQDIHIGFNKQGKWDTSTLKDMVTKYEASGLTVSTGGKDRITINPDHLKNIAKGELSSKALKKQIGWVIKKSIDMTEWQTKLRESFEKTEDLRKWVVYEAASGMYKFTGTPSSGKDYTGTPPAVANQMLVFSESGDVKKESCFKWSMANAHLVDKVSITFKGDKRIRYAKLGVATEAVYLPSVPGESIPDSSNQLLFLWKTVHTSLYEKSFPGKIIYPEQEIENIIDEELLVYEQTINQLFLDEGFGSWAKGKWDSIKTAGKAILQKVSDAIIALYEKVIKRVVGKLYDWAKSGAVAFLETLGFEIEGDAKVSTPSW